jgi:hypothetical protein
VQGGQLGPWPTGGEQLPAAACGLPKPERWKRQLQRWRWLRLACFRGLRSRGVRGGQLRAGRKLGVRARGGRGKHGGDRGVRRKRIGSTAPRDTGSGGEGSREEGEARSRAGVRARVRGRGVDPRCRGAAGGEGNRGGGIGRWEEGEREGADRWGRLPMREKRGRGAERELGRGTAHAGERRERGCWASGSAWARDREVN